MITDKLCPLFEKTLKDIWRKKLNFCAVSSLFQIDKTLITYPSPSHPLKIHFPTFSPLFDKNLVIQVFHFEKLRDVILKVCILREGFQ